MVIIKSAEGKKKNIKCIGCALQKGTIKSVGGLVAETENFDAQQDYEIPIPGFVILASKKHVEGIERFSKKERNELMEFLYKIRTAMRDVLNIKHAYLIQEEDSPSHFHIWIFPRYKWMEKFGKGVESVRPIMEYARKNMKTKNNLKKVKEAAAKIKKYLAKQ